MGIYVDQTNDIGRVEDVHFNPWFSHDPYAARERIKDGREMCSYLHFILFIEGRYYSGN